MTQPNSSKIGDAFRQLQERNANRQANRNYISVLKSLEMLGIPPRIDDGILKVPMDLLIRKEYEHMTGVDLDTYGTNGTGVNAGVAADTDSAG